MAALIDSVTAVTGKPVAEKEGSFVYMENKAEVSTADMDAAKALHAEREIEEKRAEMTAAIEQMLDKKAVEYRYDDMKSARAMAGVPADGSETAAETSMRDEALALAKWDRSCWAKSSEIEAAVQDGTRAMPTVDGLLAELPEFAG